MPEPRVLVVPGGTNIGAIALANASLHKLIELYEERQADPEHPAPHTVVVLRDPAEVAPSTLRGASQSPKEAFPATEYPQLADKLEDPDFFEGIDLVIRTSGSTSGDPRLVGLSVEAIVASTKATDAALSGPGNWILALPAHHIAGALVMLRSALAGTNPFIVDVETSFDPRALLPAIAGATQNPDVPGYLSLVPTQLAECLDADDEVLHAMRRLSAILVGGSASRPGLIERARELGLKVRETYGMTETCGGCVYDGIPLEGVEVRILDKDGQPRIAIGGPTVMTRYLDGTADPFFEEGGHTWLLTGDLGLITAGGQVRVDGRADDIIVTGGLNVAPRQVLDAALTCEDVVDVWVTSTPDEKWGEAVTALVVPRSMPTDAKQMAALGRKVRDHVGGIIGRTAAPRRVVAVDALPYLEGMKIDRMKGLELASTTSSPEREWWR